MGTAPRWEDQPDNRVAFAAGSDDWLERLASRRSACAYLSHQALKMAADLQPDPQCGQVAALLVSLADGFEKLAGAFDTA
ncbi:MAG: hypothetical protein ACYC1D_08570 [Acidimicrobiales bacterium]